MNEQLKTYIKAKRAAGLADDKIRTNLIAAGWQTDMVEVGLKANLDDDVPPPPPAGQFSSASSVTASAQPMAVVNVATTRGIEYSIMFIGLWITATAVGFLLHSSVNTLSGRESYAESLAPYAGAAAIVALPIFLLLFLRLKKAELTEPSLRSDPSRKRAIQLTLLVTFLIGIFKIIGYIFSLLNGGSESGGLFGGSYGDDLAISPIFDLLHSLITLGIAGAIFAYYWVDIHKKDQ